MFNRICGERGEGGDGGSQATSRCSQARVSKYSLPLLVVADIKHSSTGNALAVPFVCTYERVWCD